MSGPAYSDPTRRREARTLARLAAADLTYAEIGASREKYLPSGYRHVYRDVTIGSRRRTFEEAVDGLFGWRMHRGAGIAVVSPAQRSAAGATVLLRARWRGLRLTVPCRVIYTVEDNDRCGFAYGTLPGHPERGEEAFLVDLTDADEVCFRIRAFSRPDSLLSRAGGPITHMIQRYVTDRYVGAMREIVATRYGR
jgi:uncharacterized protein (UPF0548 family)